MLLIKVLLIKKRVYCGIISLFYLLPWLIVGLQAQSNLGNRASQLIHLILLTLVQVLLLLIHISNVLS